MTFPPKQRSHSSLVPAQAQGPTLFLCNTVAIRKLFIFCYCSANFFQINEPRKRSSMSELPAGGRRRRREMDAFWQQKAIVLVQLLNEISVIIASVLGLPLPTVCFPSAQLATSLEASESL